MQEAIVFASRVASLFSSTYSKFGFRDSYNERSAAKEQSLTKTGYIYCKHNWQLPYARKGPASRAKYVLFVVNQTVMLEFIRRDLIRESVETEVLQTKSCSEKRCRRVDRDQWNNHNKNYQKKNKKQASPNLKKVMGELAKKGVNFLHIVGQNSSCF